MRAEIAFTKFLSLFPVCGRSKVLPLPAPALRKRHLAAKSFKETVFRVQCARMEPIKVLTS